MHERGIINIETMRLDDKYQYGIGGLDASGLGDSTLQRGPTAKLMGGKDALYQKVTGDSGQTYHLCTWK